MQTQTNTDKYDKPFICFDGIDGSGKDTQARFLLAEIQDGRTKFAKSSSVWLTKEQTDITEEGIQISLKQKDQKFDVDEATKLFVRDRLKHSEYIRQILSHSIVISVRYFLSTLAYQSAQGEKIEEIWEMHTKPSNFFKDLGHCRIIVPDFYFYIHVDPKEAMNRIKKNRIETQFFERLDFLTKVCDQYQNAIDFLKSVNISIIEIDGMKSREEVLMEVLKHLH